MATLKDQNIDPCSIYILRQLCHMQKASVRKDVESTHFTWKQGTIQGDPPSTLLWRKTNKVSDSTRTKRKQPTHSQIRRRHLTFSIHATGMFDDLFTATAPHGWQLHHTKTKILSNHKRNQAGNNNKVKLQVMSIEILPQDLQIKYLGQSSTSKDPMQTVGI